MGEIFSMIGIGRPVGGSRLLRIALLALALTAFFLLDGIGEPNARAVPRVHRFEEDQPEIDTVRVTVKVFLPNQYELLNSYVPYDTVVNITSQLSKPLANPVTINSTMYFPLTEWPENATYTYRGYGVRLLLVHIPANTSSISVEFKGHMSGQSVLWRNAAHILYPRINVTLPYRRTDNFLLVAPHDANVVRVQSLVYAEREYGAVAYNIVESEKEKLILLSQPVPILPVVYEHVLWKPIATVLIFLAIAATLLVPYGPKYMEKLRVRTEFNQSIIRIIESSRGYALGLARGLQGRISKINSRSLLTAYVLCSLLMVSLGLAVGPEPRSKAYAIAMPDTVDEIEKATGMRIISILDTRDEFETLVKVGTVQAAIVGDFYVTEHLGRTLYSVLDEIQSIIIIESKVVSADFAREVFRRYPEKTAIFKDVNAFREAIPVNPRLVPTRQNQLRLTIDPSVFDGVVALVGILSFIQVFFGLAFLSSKLMEVGKKPGISAIPESILYACFYFFFTQLIYVVTSVLFAVPMGLHAVSSGSTRVTAVGALGFGGGSRPRMLAGMLGILFGSVAALGEGSKLSKAGLIAFFFALFSIIVDPLTGGLIFYEFILMFTVGGVELEAASTTTSYVKTFLANVGLAFGGWITPTYGISTGEIMFYMGAIPLCLFPKLQSATATLLLFFSAFSVGNGGIRVAEMTPWKTFASCIPGIATGLVIAAVFFSLSKAEAIIRARIERRGTSF